MQFSFFLFEALHLRWWTDSALSPQKTKIKPQCLPTKLLWHPQIYQYVYKSFPFLLSLSSSRWERNISIYRRGDSADSLLCIESVNTRQNQQQKRTCNTMRSSSAALPYRWTKRCKQTNKQKRNEVAVPRQSLHPFTVPSPTSSLSYLSVISFFVWREGAWLHYHI